MSGGEGQESQNPGEIGQDEANRNRLRVFEKQEFDITFSDTLGEVGEYLDSGVARNFRVRLVFLHNATTRELKEGVSYDHAYNLRRVKEDSDTVVSVELKPGSLAINELDSAIVTYGPKETQGIHRTLAHQLYSTGLIVKSYMEAGAAEIEGGHDPLIRDSAESMIDLLLDDDQLKDQIRSSDLHKRDELLKLVEYLEPKNSFDVNRHRFAASIFLKIHPEHSGIPGIMQRYLDSLLVEMAEKRTTEQEINREIYDIDHDDADLAVRIGEDNEVIYRIIDVNKEKAALIRQHIVGWAFPMTDEEHTKLYRLMNKVTVD